VGSGQARNRARTHVEALCVAPLDSVTLRRQVLNAVRDAVDFDSSVWVLTDPITTVGAAPVADVPCLPELPALIKAKYATAINRWTELQRASSRVALLDAELDGHLGLSLVWSDVMSRYGIGDVASVVFADQFGCWGFLDLWRLAVRGPFDDIDAQFLAELAPSVTTALRASQARTFVEPATAHRRDAGPVVLTLNDNLQITDRTAASRGWLDVLLPPRPDERGVPASVYNVAAQLLANEAGVDNHPASTRVHLADGFWLTLRAARLGTAIVVTIEESSATERLELFGLSFGFTPRERQLLEQLANGSDTREMARQLAVSEHTIQDHLKSIFAKVDARDRITVLSRALGARREIAS
jgi:DNA-binding CsgD family transcriptional regulator